MRNTEGEGDSSDHLVTLLMKLPNPIQEATQNLNASP